MVECGYVARIGSATASANPSSDGVNTNLRNVGGASAEFESFREGFDHCWGHAPEI